MTGPDDMLFNYYVATQPQPLQAGDESVQSNGTINLHIAAPSSGNAFADEITIAVPVGAGGLFQQTPTPSINTGKWVLTSTKKVKGKKIGLIANQDYATFTLDCQSATDYGINYNLVVALAGPVTAVEDNYQMAVLERSGPANEPNNFTLKKGQFTLAVVPPQFYLSNLVSYATGAPTVPKTEFTAAQDINLEWESNGTWFQVYKKGDTAPFWTGSQTTCTLAGGVSTDTTFFLIASMTGNPGADQAGFGTVYLFDSLTVTITNPVLTPTSVVTSGLVTVGTNLVVNGTANVAGPSTLGVVSAGTLTTSGLATLSSAAVQGALSVAAAATLSNNLTVNGATYLNGGTNISGGLTGTGSVISVLTNLVPVSPGTSYQALTDGIVLGYVGWASDNHNLCTTYISGQGPLSVWALGGSVCALDNGGNKWHSGNCGSFTMPVPYNSYWSVAVQNDPNNQENAPTAFYWIPIGKNGGSETLKEIPGAPPAPPAVPPRSIQRRSKPKGAQIDELLAIILELSDKPVPDETRKRLHDVLTKLNTDECERTA